MIVEDEKDVAAFANYTGEETPKAAPKPRAESQQLSSPAVEKAAASMPAVVAGDGSRIISSPYARKLAAEAGVSLQVTHLTSHGHSLIISSMISWFWSPLGRCGQR